MLQDEVNEMTVKDLLVLAEHYDVTIKLEPVPKNDFTIYGSTVGDAFNVYVERDGKCARCRLSLSDLSINPTHVMCTIADAVWEVYQEVAKEKNDG